jgi:hypothetical protein
MYFLMELEEMEGIKENKNKCFILVFWKRCIFSK